MSDGFLGEDIGGSIFWGIQGQWCRCTEKNIEDWERREIRKGR